MIMVVMPAATKTGTIDQTGPAIVYWVEETHHRKRRQRGLGNLTRLSTNLFTASRSPWRNKPGANQIISSPRISYFQSVLVTACFASKIPIRCIISSSTFPGTTTESFRSVFERNRASRLTSNELRVG